MENIASCLLCTIQTSKLYSTVMWAQGIDHDPFMHQRFSWQCTPKKHKEQWSSVNGQVRSNGLETSLQLPLWKAENNDNVVLTVLLCTVKVALITVEYD